MKFICLIYLNEKAKFSFIFVVVQKEDVSVCTEFRN